MGGACLVLARHLLLLCLLCSRPLLSGRPSQWINHSTKDWTRMLFVLQESKPLKVAGETVGEELAGMAGVRPSD